MNPKPRALVTGAAGFVGRHMVDRLTADGYLVSRCDVKLGWDAFDVFGQGPTDCIQHYDLVVHLAAQAPHRDAIDRQPATHIYNQHLDAAMFDWAYRTQQGRVLYFSSCAAADEYPDAYGELKLVGERMADQARAAGLPVTVVRPYSGYGADQSTDFPFGAFLAKARALADPFYIWGSGRQVRDWIHIDDVVAGALAVASSGVEGPVPLCTGRPTTVAQLAKMICDAVGYSPVFKMDKEHLGQTGADERVGNVMDMALFYLPKVTLEEGIKRALQV
jgi:nucleoside-diphosphate-sugar epimerase